MVTVITPTYNRAEYLGNAISSVLAQTYTDIEYIIVDDNVLGSPSREETEKVVNTFSDPRVKYIKNEKNLGGAESRNVGIFASTGDYIAFLDDDDEYLSDRIEVQLNAMISNNWDVCVMDGATYQYETGEKLTERHQKVSSDMAKEELIRAHLLYHISGTNTFMFKAEFLKSIGGFDDVPSCQEYILMQKALDANPKFGYIPEIHVRNYQHKGEQLSTGTKKLLGQKLLMENKRKHFNLLTKAERKQVICRHHGVLFFVHFKMKQYFAALKEAVFCFAASPKNAVLWLKEYKGKIKA